MQPDESPDYIPMIRDLPLDMRPRERMLYAGPAALSTTELLAIVIRGGRPGENVLRLAEHALSKFGGLPGLAQATFEELRTINGIGDAKATEIKAALEIGRRLLAAAPHERPQVRTPTDIANLLMLEMSLLEQEHLRVVMLDTKNYVIRIHPVYAGSLNSAVVRIAEVFREPVRANSASVILVHNHPSGDPTPSPVIWRKSQVYSSAETILR